VPAPRQDGKAVLGLSVDPREFQFVMAGFVVAWLIVLLYVLSITLREQKLRKELDRVKRMVEERK
jgi:CcmD family protein